MTDAADTLSVLVIDDSDDDRMLYRRILREAFGEGLNIAEEASGESALEAIARIRPRCVLLDYSLPGRTGIEVLKHIRPKHPYLPIILLSGQGSEAIAVQSIKEGAQNYITKSEISALVLSRVIQMAIANGALKNQIDEQHLALRESEVRFRKLLEAAPDAMVMVNQGGDIVLLNVMTETQFGYRRDELVGQPVTNIIPEGFAERLVADSSRSLAEALAQRIDTGLELTGRRKDGTEFPIEIMLSPLGSGEGIQVTATIRDISGRKLAERAALAAAVQMAKARDAAEQASRAKSRFLAGMSHELRTPLAGILGYARLLEMEGGLSTLQAERVGAMLGAGTHLLEMINCVLDLSQIEAGRFELHAVEIEPRAIAAACLDLVRPAAEAKDLALRFTALPEVPQRVMADAMRLRQVLLNLLGNAVKFTVEGSVELRLRTTARGTGLRVEVVDTGLGIPVERQNELFQNFTRLGTHATVEGAGLGLALSAQIAALMGGRLGHDDRVGGGSVFWLELPLLSRPAGPYLSNTLTPTPVADSPSRARPTALRLDRLRILVVDDVEMNREIASAFLRAAGHEVALSEDGEGAVEAVAAGDYDVVLMDVRMPNMDGLEATRRIRALEPPRGGVAIVALSAQVFAEQVQDCRHAGMDGHLGKPFTPETLLAAVLDAVTRATAARAPSEGSIHIPIPKRATLPSYPPGG